MTSKKISFTAIHKAELVEGELRELNENEVLTEMEYCDDPAFPMGTVFDWREIK